MWGLPCSGWHSAAGGSRAAESLVGYGREVFCNDPICDDALRFNYSSNAISTTKYTVATFVPKSLFEQFRRVANIFFLVVAFVSFSPLAPYRAVSIALPLFFVVSATMAKEAVEDWRRKQQDVEVNNRKVDVYDGSHTFNSTEWKKLRVGDIVRVKKDEFFPADLLLISSSSEDGFCYVETMNLDGETNLKRKQCLTVTSTLQSVHSFQKFRALIKCEDPNEKLYSFIGTMNYEGLEYSLSPQQILLRDSKLRNTHYIYGVIVFTGHDTKVMQNGMNPPSKRSKIEMRLDKIIYILFSVLIAISSTGSIFFGLKTKEDIHDGMANRWYLRPDKTSILFDPKGTSLASFFHFLTGLMLYGCLIPISLYISIEIVKVLQSTFINQDQEMYCKEMDQPAHARTSNLNEELGQVDTILSDKTGTLTCNSMEFLKCSIAGVDYGLENSEVDKALRTGILDGEIELQPAECSVKARAKDVALGKQVKGFSFSDNRLMSGSWVKEPHHDLIRMFFRVLAVCHTVIPVVDGKSDCISYEAESPDEATFVVAAKELGFKFYEKTPSSISLREFEPCLGRIVDRTYKILCTLPFSNSRKRMSLVIMTEEGQVMVFCKGADSVIFGRLAKNQMFESATKDHINKYSETGLRTMVVAYRVLSEDEFSMWHDEFLKASNAVSANRDEMVDAVAEKIEKGLILLGATAVEDRLQDGDPRLSRATHAPDSPFPLLWSSAHESPSRSLPPLSVALMAAWCWQQGSHLTRLGHTSLSRPSPFCHWSTEGARLLGGVMAHARKVPECIDKLAQAGIKIWVLTGDKLETAINIGFACHLLRKDMKQFIITLDELDPTAFTEGDEEALKKASYESVARQLHEAHSKANFLERNSVLSALVIDGNSLSFALSKDLERSFFDLASDCASVICCRTSPKQKALVANLVKRITKKTTLAIGDGANDVGMLQEADIGVGISGVEGMQAVMSSDFAIAQFRYLERLLLVHGHWCYRRIAAMICYFFYKNITFGFTLFCFEAHASFTAQPAYNDWYIAFYNVVFTSLPVIALGVFDKDVSSRLCLKYPMMHQDGVKNILFSWPRILCWMINGVFSSIIIYYFTSSAILDQAFRKDGRVGGLDILGLTMYTCVVWTVNCQLALYLNYFTWIQHLFIWGSISFWYVFLVVYGLFPPFISTSAYWVFLEAAAPSPIYWIVTLATVIIAVLPYFVYKIFHSKFPPEFHEAVQRKYHDNR